MSEGRTPGRLEGDNPEFTYEAFPGQLDNARREAQEQYPGLVTFYERLDDWTETVSWSRPDGSGTSWIQRWPDGLITAPPIGTRFQVLHDEWQEQGDGTYMRTIHAIRITEPVTA